LSEIWFPLISEIRRLFGLLVCPSFYRPISFSPSLHLMPIRIFLLSDIKVNRISLKGKDDRMSEHVTKQILSSKPKDGEISVLV
jgi:hypothetical protein